MEVLPGLQGCSDYFSILLRFAGGWQSCFHLSAIDMVCYCQGELPSTLEEPLGTILITTVEELLDDLELHHNEALTSWVVRTACSHGELPLVIKLPVLFAGKMGPIVTFDFFWSAKL